MPGGGGEAGVSKKFDNLEVILDALIKRRISEHEYQQNQRRLKLFQIVLIQKKRKYEGTVLHDQRRPGKINKMLTSTHCLT